MKQLNSYPEWCHYCFFD